MNHTIPKDIIARYLPENPIIIEAGAHIGRDTVKLAERFPNGHIHAFEPVPELFAQLKERVKNLTNVSIYNSALSDTPGVKKFYKSGGRSTATSSLFKPKEYAAEFPETTFEEISVPCTTLNAWAQEHGITHLDFMWLDMQGGELDALRGASNLLHTLSGIYTEVALTERYAENPLYQTVQQFLATHGFRVELEALGKITWGNALFIKQ